MYVLLCSKLSLRNYFKLNQNESIQNISKTGWSRFEEITRRLKMDEQMCTLVEPYVYEFETVKYLI